MESTVWKHTSVFFIYMCVCKCKCRQISFSLMSNHDGARNLCCFLDLSISIVMTFNFNPSSFLRIETIQDFVSSAKWQHCLIYFSVTQDQTHLKLSTHQEWSFFFFFKSSDAPGLLNSIITPASDNKQCRLKVSGERKKKSCNITENQTWQEKYTVSSLWTNPQVGQVSWIYACRAERLTGVLL